MYKIMVVDDEPFIADGLADLFNQIQDPPLDVSVAYSAQSALEQLDKLRMDIVISDIKMPKMNGIEMLAEIKERWPFCHVIFLSGYSDFDYVQSALKYGADSYLLKTQNDDVILETLFKTIETIEKENEAERMQRRMEAEYEYALPILQKDFLSYFLRSKMKFEGSEMQDQLNRLSIPLSADQPILLVGARIDKSNFVSTASSETVTKIDAIFTEYISPRANAFCLFEGPRYLFWLIQNNSPDYTKDSLCRYLNGTLEQIQLCCKQENLSVSFVWDPNFYEWEQLSEGYKHLRSIIYFFLNSKEKMILCDTNFFHNLLQENDTASESSIEPIIDDMRTKLEYGQMDGLLELIDKLIIQAGDNSDVINQISAYYSLCVFFIEWIERSGQRCSFLDEFGSLALFSLPQNQWTPSKMRGFRKIAEFLIEEGHSNQAQHSQRVILKLHHYISEHLASDLTLNALAEQVYLNPVYLSRFYRQETGQKLSEYVLECRMKEAKKLLRSNDDKISEIAFSVGFDSPSHFSRVFKKHTSLTPMEYREQAFTP